MPSYDTIVLLRISKALRIKLHVDLIFDATFKTTLSFDSVSKISKLSGFFLFPVVILLTKELVI